MTLQSAEPPTANLSSKEITKAAPSCSSSFPTPPSLLFLLWSLYNCVELKAMELKKKKRKTMYMYIDTYLYITETQLVCIQGINLDVKR